MLASDGSTCRRFPARTENRSLDEGVAEWLLEPEEDVADWFLERNGGLACPVSTLACVCVAESDRLTADDWPQSLYSRRLRGTLGASLAGSHAQTFAATLLFWKKYPISGWTLYLLIQHKGHSLVLTSSFLQT